MNSFYRSLPFQQNALFTSTAPFGLRLWDSVTNDMIAQGMRVTAYPPAQPARRVEAFTNRQGVYILRNLPGLRTVEQGKGDAAFWTTQRATKRFLIEVIDITQEQRFQPFFFPADLPQKGLFSWKSDEGSSNSDTAIEAPIPLFSAPTRLPPGAMAVLRAEVWDTVTQKPAPWAVLHIELPGLPAAQSFSDRQGRVALIFPYPQPANTEFGAPEIALIQQEWRLSLQAHYSPQQSIPALPDLYETLAQTPATLWLDAAGTQACTEVTLKFGQETIFPPILWITANR